MCLSSKKQRKRRQREQCPPETVQTSCTCFASLPFYNITANVVTRLYHSTGNKEKKKKKEEQNEDVTHFLSLCLFPSSLHSIRSFHFFFLLERSERTEIPCIFSPYFSFYFQILVCHYYRCFSLIFQFVFQEREKKKNE